MNHFKYRRTGMLIDAENLEIHARNYYRAKIDYPKLLQKLKDRELIRILYFKPENTVNMDWKHVLSSWGVELKTTPKNVDTWLTVFAITLAEKCDSIIIVAGDGDYCPLIWFLQSKGVKTEVWSWLDCTSTELKNLADAYVPLTTDLLVHKPNNLISLKPKRRKSHA